MGTNEPEFDTAQKDTVQHPLQTEGFRQLSQVLAASPAPAPERGWRTGFTIADVAADIPAERSGHNKAPASQELYDRLREGDNQLVVGTPGAGKSTLCQQVAVRWHEATATGPVFYRPGDQGRAFTSTAALETALTTAEEPVLVVVEDAVRAGTTAIFDVIEALDATTSVGFLLDARYDELEAFQTAGTGRESTPRQKDIAGAIPRYSLPELTEPDVGRVVDAFEAATGRAVRHSHSVADLYEQIQTTPGPGAMLLLAYFLPVGPDDDATTGLETHVARRYRTLEQPATDDALRDLTQFEPELLADVGAMVALLNATGIGTTPALIHALGHHYGHDTPTHDEIAAIRTALDGWFLVPGDDDHPTTHEVWSTLYLRELARAHADQQAHSGRVARSEPRFARCLDALFALIDDDAQRAALAQEFPDATVIAEIAARPAETADEYLDAIVTLGQRWAALAPLYGTTETARYELPESATATAKRQAITARAETHAGCGQYANARAEYDHLLEQARAEGDRRGERIGLTGLGTLERYQGNHDDARAYYEQSLNISQESDDRYGMAASYNALGYVAYYQGDHDGASEHFEQSLEIAQDIDARYEAATSHHVLGHLDRYHEHYETAKDHYERSLDLRQAIGARPDEASTLAGLGRLARAQGDSDTAKAYHERSLEISQNLGDRHGESRSLRGLGDDCRHLGDYDAAKAYHERSLAIRQELGNSHAEAMSLLRLGELAHEQDDYDTARTRLDAARQIFVEIGAVRDELTALATLIETALDHEHTAHATEYCELAQTRLDESELSLTEKRERIEALCTTGSQESDD